MATVTALSGNEIIFSLFQRPWHDQLVQEGGIPYPSSGGMHEHEKCLRLRAQDPVLKLQGFLLVFVPCIQNISRALATRRARKVFRY